MIALGAAGWWYNASLAADGQFSLKLCILGPLGVFGGLLMLVRPDWAGPLRKDSSPAHKAALVGLIVLMAAGSGITFYALNRASAKPARTITRWSPEMGTPVLPGSRKATPSGNGAASIAFLDRQYRLGSYNQKNNPMWEFVTGDEGVGRWTTLLTIIDRPDARSAQDLDRLAEGITNAQKSKGAQILSAKTLRDATGANYNYMVAAFQEPANHRFELNFTKFVMGPKNAAILIYAARITDPRDYQSKAKAFLTRESGAIGRALEELALPDLSKLPRREF